MDEYNKYILDILNSTQSIDSKITDYHGMDAQWEQQILQAVRDIRGNISQSAARENREERRKGYQSTRDTGSKEYRNLSSSSSNKNFSFRGIGDEFKKGLSKGILEAFGMSDFKKKVGDALGNLAQSIGIDVKDIPMEFGKELSKSLMGNLSNSKIFGDIFGKLKGGLGGLGDNIAEYINSFAPNTPNANPQTDSQSDAQDEAISNIESVYTEHSNREIEILEHIQYDADTILDYLIRLNPKVTHDISMDRNAERKAREKAEAEAETRRQDEGLDELKDMGVDKLKDLGKDKLKGVLTDKLGSEGAGKVFGDILGKGGGSFGKIFGGIFKSGGAMTTAGGSTVAAGGTTVAGGAAAGSSGLAGLASSVGMAVPQIAIIAVAAMVLMKLVKKAIAPALESIQKFTKVFGNAWNRSESTNKKNMELANERRKKDIEAIIEKPFQLLESSFDKILQSWDENLKTITATQGYSKADLQDLMAAYGARLQSEGLSKYINAADIPGNLSKVLESGLSGKVAEEFAYLATKLNAAIPTEDFFSYGATYFSIAANMIAQGKSQSEAIAYANQQLELFASNILYASRQLAGGFSTGLKDASSLFASAQQIARASKTGSPSMISGVLASVSAIIGAVAPDLASSIVDKVVSAAIGGNESSLVALRSLTGLNASNTQFLNMLATNPQEIFYRMFSGLGRMQNMSNDAYMEVAEGLSSVFGVDMAALASVDFQYLADNIRNMRVGYESLDENMKMLVSGQTTSREEQMLNEKINQTLIDEGLSYVLDNEVARTIWKHMKDEQLAREMEQATYAVDLQGAAMELIQSLVQTVINLANILNPFSFFRKLTNVIQTANEAAAQEADLYQILQLGKVGSGRRSDFYNLVTRNQNLNLIDGLATLMGGASMWRTTNSFTQLFNDVSDAVISGGHSLLTGGGMLGSLIKSGADTLFSLTPIGQLQNLVGSMGRSAITSRYSWGTASKSGAKLISDITSKLSNNVLGDMSGSMSQIAESSKSGNDALRKRVEQLISQDNIQKYVEEGKGYDYLVDDVNKAANGISNFEETLESLGYEISDIKKLFEDSATERGVEEQIRRREVEENAWKSQISVSRYIKGDEDSLIQHIEEAINRMDVVMSTEGYMYAWYLEWQSYVANRSGLSENTLSRIRELEESKNKEDREGLMYRLADILTDAEGDDLENPSVQTNVILAEILLLLKSAMSQSARTGGLSLPDTLAALALGIVNRNP